MTWIIAYTLSASALAAEKTCPTSFHDLSLPASSSQCRVFGVNKPSTISFFVMDSPVKVAASFSKQLVNPQQTQHPKILEIVSEDAKYRVFVYQDGPGTQINILAE